MIPLVPTLVLAFVSFLSSIYVVLSRLIPILPPHPLSRRVAPSEFGLPNYRKLAPADKAHLWLAACDLLALVVFLWQVVSETMGGVSSFGVANDPLAAVRLWLANTLRITCFSVIIGITLLHVRLGRPVAFGFSHYLIWGPVLILVVTSTAVAGVIAGTELSPLFVGIAAYSGVLAALSTVTFAGLVATLLIIRKNLTAVNDSDDSWPPMRQVEDKPRPSFATEDVEGLKDGSSWITSNASSRAESVSAFSFSTHHTHANHSVKHSNGSLRNILSGSVPPKSSYWFNPSASFLGRNAGVPPVPPLPMPYRPSSPTSSGLCDDPDPFRANVGNDPRVRLGSQSSWLTEPSFAQTTLTAWSFPQSRPTTPASVSPSAVDLNDELLPSTVFSRSLTPAISSAQVLGGYGYSAETAHTEKGHVGLSAVPEGDLDVPVLRVVSWLIHLLVPFALSLPYMCSIDLFGSASNVSSILLILSITLSSPILALNVIFDCPLPIPSGLFDSPKEHTTQLEISRSSSPTLTRPWSHDYKRSGSVTVVEGRRSGDVWLSNGNAVDGRKKIGRALDMLHSKPKLSVLPFEEQYYHMDSGALTPPLPIQEAPATVPPTPQSEHSAELGRKRKESKASSYYSGADDSVAFATKIMVAQRHYSTLATTMVLPPTSPDLRTSFEQVDAPFATSTAVAATVDNEATRTPQTHLRSRSTSSIGSIAPRSVMSPPPSFPLPPTPPSVKALRHRKSVSSGFSFGAVFNGNTTEIDALSAGLLPLLVPGLKIGSDMSIREDRTLSRGSRVSREFRSFLSGLPSELGGVSSDFLSPQVHSTPANGKRSRGKKSSAGHNRHHYSLPSLSLKDGTHSFSTWQQDLSCVVEIKNDERDRSRTFVADQPSETGLAMVAESDDYLRPSDAVRHPRPTSSLTDAPSSARSSMATLINALDHEFKDPLITPSDITTFDFGDELSPMAQSTPHDSKQAKSHEPTKASRRSSIVYIKSDEKSRSALGTNTSTNLAQWPSRAVKPLTKSTKPKGKRLPSNDENVNPSSTGGLRQLSLLQDRDATRSNATAVVDADNSKTRPLSLKKKQKVVTDENIPRPLLKPTRNLKPLKLARSDTSKARAALRKQETIPEVVVRPPSEHAGFGYDFRQF